MFYPEGIFPAMITPYEQVGRVNEKELRRLIDFGIDRGLHGLFPVSSVGEGIHLEHDEKCRFMDIVMDQTAGRVPVAPGIAASHPTECVSLAKHAAEIGCQAVVATPPYFYKYPGDMVEEFFLKIADESPIPVILYNIPLFTQPVPYDVVEHLVKHENVVGMKDSSGSIVDFMHFMDKMRSSGGKANMLIGREEGLLAALAVGARGCMTACSHVIPEVMVGIWDAWNAGDIEKAREYQNAMLPLIRLAFMLPFPIAFKLILEMRGFDMGVNFMPLSADQKAACEAMKPRLREVLDPLVEKYGR